MIYFDNAATSLLKPYSVKRAVIDALDNYTANPGRSGHFRSMMVAEKIFDTREMLKHFFNANDYEVIFTKNCTEALNLAILGTLKAKDHIIVSCYEHNSVLRTLEHLKKDGIEVTMIYSDLNDFSNHLEESIKVNTKMVICTMVSNVTGESSDVESIGNFCQKHKLIYLADGAQASGHIKIDLTNSNIDLFCFAGHKGLMSITGVGGLVVKKGIKLSPIMFGGTGTESENLNQPDAIPEGFEAGTLPSIPIISLKAGVEFLEKNFSKIIEKEEKLTNYLYNSLKNLKFLTIYSKDDSKNVISFNMKNLDSSYIADLLDEKFQICVRAGLHCAPLIHKKLDTINTGTVRVSLDYNNRFEEIDRLVYALKYIYSSLS